MIALAADHGGYELKEAIKQHLEAQGIEDAERKLLSAIRTYLKTT